MLGQNYEGEFLFFLNNDAFIEKNTISALVEIYNELASKDAKIGALQPKLVFIDELYYDGFEDSMDSFNYPFILGHEDVNRLRLS